jgi:hypothetical protein
MNSDEPSQQLPQGDGWFAMQTVETSFNHTHDGTTASAFVPLDHETRAAVETACAAYHLNRKPQTLRAWACLENGPLLPVRVHGRLAWPVAELRRVLGMAK